ncbi:MAG: hypothetical protein M3530_11035 [Thermoproteota archaeon]|nr:hypothetical protein [Thermoproteota archaeon]
MSIDVLNNERFNKWGKPFPLSIPQQQYDSALPGSEIIDRHKVPNAFLFQGITITN